MLFMDSFYVASILCVVFLSVEMFVHLSVSVIPFFGLIMKFWCNFCVLGDLSLKDWLFFADCCSPNYHSIQLQTNSLRLCNTPQKTRSTPPIAINFPCLPIFTCTTFRVNSTIFRFCLSSLQRVYLTELDFSFFPSIHQMVVFKANKYNGKPLIKSETNEKLYFN